MIKEPDEIRSLLESKLPDILEDYDSLFYEQLYLTLYKLQKHIDIEKIINEVFFESFSAFGRYFKFEGEEDQHYIIINSMFFSDIEKKIIQALIAHEVAHYFLGHTGRNPNKLPIEEEYDANVQAKKWGFDIDALEKFRSKYYQPIERECEYCKKNKDFFLIYYNRIESKNICHKCLKELIEKGSKIEDMFLDKDLLLYQFNKKREASGDLP